MNKRKNIKLTLIFLMIFLIFPSIIMAQGIVVASTSLAGAIAKAAGAKDIRVLTPSEIKHPPEYDLKPSDLMKFEGADIVVYGGYEKMVSKLIETSKNKNIIAIQIDTTTSPQNLIEQVRKISKFLKTEKWVEEWEKEFSEKLKKLQNKLSPYFGKRAVVHKFAQPFARWAGFQVVHVINPGELTPKVIADSISKKPDIVIDVAHFPIAKVVAENAGCRYIQVINFPGIGGTQTLEDIFEYNSKQLIQP